MRRVLATLALLLPAAVLAAQQPQATFKSTVDLVAVDVSIVDKNGRPVDDIRVDEFSLKVDGKPRRLSSAEFVSLRRPNDVPEPESPAYNTNQGAKPGRLILIVVDEGNIHKGNGRNVMAAAAKYIDSLNPSDRVSLEFIPGTGPLVGFTSNHALVKRMLENGVGKMIEANLSRRVGMLEAMTFVRDGDQSQTWLEVIDRECAALAADPVNGFQGCKQAIANEARSVYQAARAQTTNSMLSLRAIMQRLIGGTTSPKTVVLITEGIVIDRNTADISWVGPITSQAQVNLFAIQVDGSFTDASTRGQSPTHYEDHDLFVEGLNRLTGEARGIVLPVAVNANAAFSRLDLELSGYYLLSFEPDLVDRDGKAHNIEVKVNRRGVDVRARPAFVVAPPAVNRTPDDILAETLKNPLPSPDVPMKLTTFTYRDDTKPGRLKVLVTGEIDRALNPAGEFTLGYIVTDARGNLVASQFEKALAAPRGEEGRPQRYTGAVVLDEGVYTIKFAVADPQGRAGSVERTIDASLAKAGPLTLGELMLAEVQGRSARPSVDGRITANTLMAYAEAYGDGKDPLSRAVARIEVGRTEHDPPVETADLAFADRDTPGKRTAEGAVPVAMLPAGDYVARAVFTIDGKVIGQISRPFTVTHSDAAPAAPGPAPRTASTSATRIAFTSKIDAFERESVLTPRVVSFFIDRMNIVGMPAMPAALAPAVTAARAGQFAAAATALAAAPPHPAASFLLGLTKLAENELPAADANFRDVLKSAPDFFPAAFYLGAARALTGRDADAVAIWQTALITEADAPFVYTVLGDAMLRLHKTADAIGLLREAMLLWPASDEVTIRFGTALAQGGQSADALKVLDPYLDTHPADQDRLLLAMRLIYEAKSAGHALDTPERDRDRFNRYFTAYEKTGGAQLQQATDWKRFIDRQL